MITQSIKNLFGRRDRNQGKPARLLRITPFLPFVILNAWMLLTAPFATHPLALTPLGFLNVAIVSIYTVLRVTRWLSPRVNLTRWSSGAMAILFLFPGHTQLLDDDPIYPSTSAFWPQMSINISLLANPSAWNASFDLHPEMGLSGMAPLVYRPLVEGFPITLASVPTAHPGAHGLYAVSGYQIVPVDSSASIWSTIPYHALPVQNFVLSNNQPYSFPNEAGKMIHMLAINCQQCLNAYRVNINPEYLERLAWDVTKFVIVSTPPGRALYLSEALTGIVFLDSWIRGEQQAALAALGGWGASKLVKFAIDSDSVASALASTMIGKGYQTLLDPNGGVTWNYQIYQKTIGITTIDQNTYAWRAATVDTYKTSFFRFDYDVHTQGSFQFSQISSHDLSGEPIELPALFQQNMKFLSNPADAAMPPITIRDPALDLLDRPSIGSPDINQWEIFEYDPLPDITPLTPSDNKPFDFSSPDLAAPDVKPYEPTSPSFTFPDTTSFDNGVFDFGSDHSLFQADNKVPQIDVPAFDYSPITGP